jgi:hypothetical protein
MRFLCMLGYLFSKYVSLIGSQYLRGDAIKQVVLEMSLSFLSIHLTPSLE